MEREVPERHANVLKAICRLQEQDDLPEKVVAKYWELKRCLDRAQCGLSNNDLGHIGMACGYGKPLPEVPLTLAQRFTRHELPVDTKVRATIGKKVVDGVLRGVKPDGRLVIDVEGEERTLAHDKVELVQTAA